MFRKLLILLLFCQTIFAGVNLEVTLEMQDAGFNSDKDDAAIVWPHSYIYLDSDDYDGATYYYEIVALNGNASYDYDVDLYDVTNGAVKATVTIPKSTSAYTRFRTAAWSPASNDTIIYGTRMPQTAADEDVRVFASRIIIVQVNATKTRLQFPLLGRLYRIKDVTYKLTGSFSEGYTQGTPAYYGYYNKDTSVLADISNWSFEAVLKTSSVDETAYAALFDATDNDQVDNSEVTVLGATVSITSVDFTNSETNFDEGHNFELRIKISNGAHAVSIYRASLYCRLTNLTKAEIYKRAAIFWPATKTAFAYVYQRVLLDTSAFSSPTIYLEGTAICADNANVAFLRDHSTNDVGTDGDDVADSGLNFNSATKVRIRTGAIVPDDDDRFYLRTTNTTNNLTISDVFVIIDCESAAPPAAPAGGQVIIINEDW